ncbi:MAG: c-type cytochrome domain-containing protein, partial [Planctomycetaceae bacterium]
MLSGLLLTGVGAWLTGAWLPGTWQAPAWHTRAMAQPPAGPAPLAPPVTPAQPDQAERPAGSPEDLEFFEQRIRPLLVEHCYACHNSSRAAEGGLALDAREPLRRGGDSGPVLVPGQPEESLLLQVVRQDAGVSKMPKGGPRLTAGAVADLRRWIERGGVDPRDQPPSAAQLEQATAWPAVFERRKRWWSFQPVRQPELPAVPPLFAAARVENPGNPGQPAVEAGAEWPLGSERPLGAEEASTGEPPGDTHVIDR